MMMMMTHAIYSSSYSKIDEGYESSKKNGLSKRLKSSNLQTHLPPNIVLNSAIVFKLHSSIFLN